MSLPEASLFAHKTPSQRAMMAVGYLDRFAVKAKMNQGSRNVDTPIKSSREAGNLFGVSERYVREAKRIMTACQKIACMVEDGEISIPSALRMINMGEDERIFAPICEEEVEDRIANFYNELPQGVSRQVYNDAGIIDVLVTHEDCAIVCEVKRELDRKSIYSAIGQSMIYREAIKKDFSTVIPCIAGYSHEDIFSLMKMVNSMGVCVLVLSDNEVIEFKEHGGVS